MPLPGSFLESPQPSWPLHAFEEHPCLFLIWLPSPLHTHRAGRRRENCHLLHGSYLCAADVCRKLLDTNGKPRTAGLLQAKCL